MSEEKASHWQYQPNKEVPSGEQLPPGVRRIALGIEYDGSPFCGWQKQQHSPSVQEPLEQAISNVANEPIKLVCAGRTDTGVHASAQVVHFDTHCIRSERNWMMGVNSAIDHSVSVVWAKEVVGQFHARFSALSRTYRYIIANVRHRPALLNKGVTWIRDPLNEKSMDEALAKLRGKHDFTSYRGVKCQASSPIRHIHHTQVTRRDDLIIIEITANAFLLHMVRNIVGQLLEIGRGQIDENEMVRVLNLKDRTKAGVTALPDGLYFVDVRYPDGFQIPSKPLGPFFLTGE